MALDETITSGETGHIAAHAALKTEYGATSPAIADYTSGTSVAVHATIHNALHARQNALTNSGLPTNLTGNISTGHLAHHQVLHAAYNTRTAGGGATATVNIFPTQTPTSPNLNDNTAITLSTRFQSSTVGKVTAIRFYAASTLPTSAQGLLYSDTGDVLFQGTFSNITAGWNSLTLPTPFELVPNTYYRAAYFTNGPYVNTGGGFASSITSGPLTATSGYYRYEATPAFPTSQFGNGNYFADVAFEYSAAPQTVPDAPAAPEATPYNTQAFLLWDAPSDGNSAITSYEVQSFAGATAGSVVSSGINQHRAMTSLTNGTAYQFRVRAINSVGTGAWSALSTAQTPAANKGLTLPLIAWEGGPAFYKKFSKADAAGWDDPTFIPMMSFSNSFDGNDQILWDMDHGINVYHGLNPFSNWAQLTTTGMFYVGPAYTYQGNGQTMPANFAQWVGYNMPDEVDGTSGSGQNAVDIVKQMSDEYAALNDGRVITANYTQTTLQPSFAQYSDQLYNYKNIHGVSIDMYWYTIPNSSFGVGYVSAVNGPANPRSASSYGAMVRGMRQINAASGKLKPMWMFVECLSGSPGENFVRDITPAELKGAVMSSIIAEARGIMWFNNVASQGFEVGNVLRQAQVQGSGFRGAAQIAAMKEVNDQVKALAPVINSQSYTWSFGTNMDTMLKYQGGFAYVFAMMSNNSATGSRTFTLPSEVTGTSVEVVGESRTLTATSGVFTDTFAAESSYHIYRIAV